MAHPEEERQELGRKLAKARADAGYSLQSAADELTKRGFEIKRGTIGAWETGRNLPDALWLQRLARVYATTVDAMTGDENGAWPFSEELQETVLLLSDEELYRAETVLRAHLGLPQNRVSRGSRKQQFDTVKSTPDVHHPALEDGAGWPEEHQVPAPKEHDRRTQDRGRTQPKSRRSA